MEHPLQLDRITGTGHMNSTISALTTRTVPITPANTIIRPYNPIDRSNPYTHPYPTHPAGVS